MYICCIKTFNKIILKTNSYEKINNSLSDILWLLLYLSCVPNHNGNNNKFIMKTRVQKQSDAFKDALDVCYLYGLNWREHIMPKTFKNTTIGYYILDETKSTVIETINI